MSDQADSVYFFVLFLSLWKGRW